MVEGESLLLASTMNSTVNRRTSCPQGLRSKVWVLDVNDFVTDDDATGVQSGASRENREVASSGRTKQTLGYRPTHPDSIYQVIWSVQAESLLPRVEKEFK